VKLLYDTASRISEIMNIKLRDVDLNTKEIQVMGKGRKPRIVYFHESTATMFKEYLEKNNLTDPNTPVFNIKPITVWYNLKKYGKELLSRDLHPHMLRHSRLQHMADDGVDSFAIKSYAGHSDISTTQIYVKSSKFQGKIAFDKAGDVWNKKKKDEQKKLC
ncbi:MAG: tyrosine-type recombinase/integrase, partial [Candidatus Woesearchaeota archaeon]|nr:tyrosine-type recombinase/integrase [Candidatus Woesearchaeota archaeon]